MQNVTDLRKHLFDVLEQLKDKKNPMEIERARAIAEVAQTVINSAKVEVEFAKATGLTTDSGFIQAQEADPKKRLTTTGRLT